MRLSAFLLDHCVTALSQMLTFAHPADSVLRHYFRENPKLGAQDRSFIAETLFGILRRRHLVEHLAGSLAARPLLLAYLAKLLGMNLRELQPFVGKQETDWISGLKAASKDDLPLAVQSEFPEWVITKLQKFMSDEDILALGQGMQSSAPLDLRVNTLRAGREEVLETLGEEGIEAQATPYSPIGIRLKDKPSINRHPLFVEGKIEVQDEGSQLLGYLVAPKRHEMVVDFCAGSGGKSLLLGAMMNSQGRIYAFDVSEKRLNNLKPRLKRSGLSNLYPQRIENENDVKIKRLAGKIDRALVDAPCSGLGTLRRNPDLKWRQSPEGIAEMAQKQAAILTSAARLLKPGGRLVYATCSFLPEENQNIVSAFLESHPHFTACDCRVVLAQQKIPLDTGKYLELFPHIHGTDGFFAAVLENKGVAP